MANYKPPMKQQNIFMSEKAGITEKLKTETIYFVQ